MHHDGHVQYEGDCNTCDGSGEVEDPRITRAKALVEKWSTEHQEDMRNPLIRCPRYHFALELAAALK